ncbi:MAG TPA: Uma2 family endonuclease [Solirubrobacteraceae bacterium]|nr:Uma2 family endonuclease [Solirubrobacteraceae bacterium]
MAIVQRMTADEYLAQEFDEVRSELVEGEVVVHDPLNLHQVVVLDLLRGLDAWVAERPGRGAVSIPLDVKLDERNVFGPDLMWYAQGRAPGRHDHRPYPIPDLVVEVRSPSTWRYDIGAKKAAYERGGLPELWLVDTAADVVLVFRRSWPKAATFDVALELAIEDELTSPLLPGFTYPLRTLFDA